VISEWRIKVDDLSVEIEASQRECRNFNSEVFRLQGAWDETIEQLDIVKRENKNLGDEIKDLLEQLSDGGRSIHELDKQRRRFEVEKEELQAALEDAEASLEQEENKVLRSQLELGQVKHEIDRKVHEKEEEFTNSRLKMPFLVLMGDYNHFNFQTIEKTIKELWIHFKHHSRQKQGPSKRLFVSRKS